MSTDTVRPTVEHSTRAHPLLEMVRRRPAELIIAMAVLVRIPLIFLPIVYREDIWRQADTASVARNFLTDPNILFPRIDWGGAGPGYVEMEFPLYPWTVSLLYRIFGEHVWLGRAVALAASAVTLWLFWRLAERTMDRRPALFALAFFAVSPLFLRLSVAFMPEATTMAAYLGSLLLFDRWLSDRRWSTALACGATTALAGLLKPTALNVGIVFVILLLARREFRRLHSGQAIVLGLVALLPVAAWLWHGAALHAEFGNTFGVISGGDSKFGNIQYWTSLHFYTGAAWIETIWVYAIGAIPLGIGGLIIASRRASPLLAPSGFLAMAVYFFVIARYAEDNLGLQYHVFSVPYAALAVGLGADWLLQHGVAGTGWSAARGARAIAVVLAAVTVAGAVYIYTDEFVHDFGGAQTIACGSAIQTVVPHPGLVVITSPEAALVQGRPNNFQDPRLFFHGGRRGWSLATDQDGPRTIEDYRLAGARWLVVNDHARLDGKDHLRAYVAGLAQMGPGVDAGCGIYRLDRK